MTGVMTSCKDADISVRRRLPRTFWSIAHAYRAKSESERIQSIRDGFTIMWADAAKQTFQMPTKTIADLLNLSVATYERRRKDGQALDVAASERLDRILGIALAAEEVFEDKKAATQWMITPNQALGGESPLMHCETEIGARQVKRILNALEWGGVA